MAVEPLSSFTLLCPHVVSFMGEVTITGFLLMWARRKKLRLKLLGNLQGFVFE